MNLKHLVVYITAFIATSALIATVRPAGALTAAAGVAITSPAGDVTTHPVLGHGPVTMSTGSQFVAINGGLANHSYSVTYTMHLCLDSPDTSIASDDYSGAVTTNGSGHWQWDALGTGVLTRTMDLSWGTKSLIASSTITVGLYDGFATASDYKTFTVKYQ